MARTFVAASSTYMEVDAAPVTSMPLTMAAWMFVATGAGGNDCGFWLGDKDSASNWWFLGRNSGGSAIAQKRDSTATSQASGGNHSSDTWFHSCGVFASATDTLHYFNGAVSANNTTSASPANADRVGIGRLARSSPTDYWDGRICEAAIWNVALNADEVAALANGVSPWSVRPGSLAFYVPTFGVDSPERDLSGNGNHLTLTNSPAAAAHAPVSSHLYVPARWSRQVEAAAAGTNPRRRALLGVGV